MGIRIKDATLIDELKDHLMLPVGNTDGDTDGCVSLGKVKGYIDADKATVAFTGSYLNLTDTPNPDDYVTMTTLNQNYYTKTQVNNLIDGVSGPVYEKVEQLPEVGKSNVIYLVPQEGGGQQNIFDEYVWLEDGLVFEKIGSSQADFSNYYTISEVDALIPTVNDPTITFKQGSTTIGSITLNQSKGATLTFSSAGAAQIPSDWAQTDPTAVDYIKNKPTIPTVNDPTITISQGGVTKGVITLNQSEAQTINLESQVQSDWAEKDTASMTYIKNKPSIPTVNDPTITITQGGVTKGSFSLNQTSGATIALDAGGGTSVQSDWAEKDTASMAYIKNKPSLSLVATSGSYTDLTDKPKLSAVATSGDYKDLSNTPSLATVATSGSYTDLTDKPVIPTNTRTLLITYDDGKTETINVYTT